MARPEKTDEVPDSAAAGNRLLCDLHVCGMLAASSLDTPYLPHDFHNLNASIWTSTPVHVDLSSQNYERLAAAVPATAPYQSVANNSALIDHTAENAAFAETAEAEDPGNPMCQQRYRSYRASDNTYQPFGGGPRRACELSPKATFKATTQATGASASVIANPSTDHQAWCQARYSSYNPLDDTYQPFGGGSRRVCASPDAIASNG
jgi:hypothetical protein